SRDLRRNRRLNNSFSIGIHVVAAHTSSMFRNDFDDESRMRAASGCCFGTTALERPTFGPQVGLPMVSPLWHNGSQLLEWPEKVSMAGAKSLIPCQFYPLEERLNEQEARRRRRRGRACSPVGCASTNRERHTVRPAQC